MKQVKLWAVQLIVTILVFASPAVAQTVWQRTYGGTSVDQGFSVQQTSDSCYIIVGFTWSFGTGSYDVYLIKTNATGDTLWTRTYGGPDVDWGYSVQQTLDGGYIIAGQTSSFPIGQQNVYLIKTNASGDTQWTRAYGGTRGDQGYSVQQTSDRGYVIAGSTTSFGAGNGDVYLIKTNASGDTQWTRTYGGPYIENCWSVQQTSDGGYVIAGVTNSFGAGNGDVYLIKTNASGDTQWTRTYGGTSEDDGYSVRQTLDGGYVIAGTTSSFGAGRADVYLIKTNAAGDTQWTRTYGGTSDDDGSSVRQTSDGGYIIAGLTSSFGAGQEDVYLIRTDSSGDTLWTRTYGGTNDDGGNSVWQTLDGGYIVAGFTFSFGAGGEDVYLIKTDADGLVGVAEPAASSEQRTVSRIAAAPNPFASFTRIPGHEGEPFDVYDISGKMVGTCRGNRIGEGLAPAVYLIKGPKTGDGRRGSVRVVKVK